MSSSTFRNPGLDSWDAQRDRWQGILNEFPIPPRRRQHGCRIRVTSRLVWERDGLELLDTVAYAWAGRLVLVEVLDHRRQIHGAWLHVSDVRRRTSVHQ